MAYQKILLALDLSNTTQLLCDKARDLAKCNQAQLALIHVIEPLVMEYAYDALPMMPVGVEEEMLKSARKEIRRLGDTLAIPEERCWVELGGTKSEILRIAREHSFDLIIIGSHGRHGVALLLGSTANAVLHGAPCDVLAVRVG
jgi:universal stress protein A